MVAMIPFALAAHPSSAAANLSEVYRDGELNWQRPEPPVAHHR
jgi:hypothetical protein